MPTFMKAPRLQHPMSEDIDDVRRALTIVFRGADGLARPDVERTFSFDMEWVAPHEAEEVVNALLATGWLEERGAELHLAVPLGTVDVPFGWFPRPARLLRPVAASSMTEGTETDTAPLLGSTGEKSSAAAAPSSAPTKTAAAPRPSRPASTGDPRARLTQRVARFIARQSGLELDELHRRADRKTRAFQLITPWMAYALVAREQGLVMDDIVKALDIV